MDLCSEYKFHIPPPESALVGGHMRSPGEGINKVRRRDQPKAEQQLPVQRRCQRKTDSSLSLQLGGARVPTHPYRCTIGGAAQGRRSPKSTSMNAPSVAIP